jgi:D-beta-D-heptose 7-phosphate kinase/D-beta-D-heptose 1-phosphate adenosyltransferase
MGETMKVGFVNGCFDILHVGHIELLSFAKTKCDHLVVAIDSDARVVSLKGQDRPFNDLEDRMLMLSAIRHVDEVKSFATASELESIVREINPDVMIVGSDYKDKEVVGSKHAKELLFFRRIDGYSTTKILENSSDR